MDLNFVILAVGLVGALFLAGMALFGSSAEKARARRLEALRERLSSKESVQVEKQFKRALAARRPKKGGKPGFKQNVELRFARAGKDVSGSRFVTIAGSIGGFIFLILWVLTGQFLLALFVALLLAAGLPFLYTGRQIKKRQNEFIKTFPSAIDLLVRGLRSGLPVTETIGMAAKELEGPVAIEFRQVSERMKIGRTMDDALAESAKRLALPEFDFFCITLAIQRETGGNLAETLGNLSSVLRSRAAMRLKVKAMASEGKASAYIVGALPFVVFGLMFYIDPSYIGGFFTDDRLMLYGMGGLVWMGIGIFIMSKMINFEI